jgi:hypothetical protein
VPIAQAARCGGEEQDQREDHGEDGVVVSTLVEPSASAKRLSALRSAAAASVVPGGMYSFILNGPVVGSFSAIQAL